MNRNAIRLNMAKDIISILDRHTNGYVFGGYVRDLIAGKPFNDINYSMKDLYPVHQYLDEKFEVTVISTNSSIMESKVIEYFIFPKFVYEFDIEIELNIAISKKNVFMSAFTDASINYLFMKNGVIKAHPQFNLGIIKEQIKNKEFLADANNVCPDRIKKMTSKGYKPIFVRGLEVECGVCRRKVRRSESECWHCGCIHPYSQKHICIG